MNITRTWLAGAALAIVLVLSGLVTTSAYGQATPPARGPQVGFCSASGGMMANVDAKLAAHDAHMDAAVAAGWLTQARADAMTAAMRAGLEDGQPGAGWHGMMGTR